MSYSKVASGNISPARFVKLDSSNTGRVLQCAANTDVIYGISQPQVHLIPFLGLDDGYAAIQGQMLTIYGPDPQSTAVLLTLGGTVSNGDRLTSDGSGQGITSTSDGDHIGAIALSSGTSGQQIPVEVVRYERAS